MIAGGAAILWRRSARFGAAALAAIYFVFRIFWVPRLYTAPHYLGIRIPVYIGVLAGLGMELVAFAGGALVFGALAGSAGSSSATGGSSWPDWPRTFLVIRSIVGLCSIDFGLNHLLDIKDNLIYVPKWMPPGQQFWVIATGLGFVLAGLALLTGIQDLLAGRLLALMFFTFNLLALPQFIFADPKDHAAWGGNAFNLALVATNWILADAILIRRRELQNPSKRADPPAATDSIRVRGLATAFPKMPTQLTDCGRRPGRKCCGDYSRLLRAS